jgi:hypothetical protein
MTVEQYGVLTFVMQKISGITDFGIFKDHCFHTQTD